jgi:integrase/recombinase XerD
MQVTIWQNRLGSFPQGNIQEISGHRTLAALERYLGVTEKQKQNAISALDF